MVNNLRVSCQLACPVRTEQSGCGTPLCPATTSLTIKDQTSGHISIWLGMDVAAYQMMHAGRHGPVMKFQHLVLLRPTTQLRFRLPSNPLLKGACIVKALCVFRENRVPPCPAVL